MKGKRRKEIGLPMLSLARQGIAVLVPSRSLTLTMIMGSAVGAILAALGFLVFASWGALEVEVEVVSATGGLGLPARLRSRSAASSSSSWRRLERSL